MSEGLSSLFAGRWPLAAEGGKALGLAVRLPAKAHLT